MSRQSIISQLNINLHKGRAIKRRIIDARENTVAFINRQALINFTHNDYLGLSTHPAVKKSFMQAANDFGLGSSASPTLSGYYNAHRELEDNMAAFLQRDRAMLFNSGFNANLGVIAALANRHSTIYADKFCHASILAGIQLSRARHIRFNHNDVQHAESLQDKQTSANLLITESVFSMSGVISPLPELATLAKKYQASLLIDDAHGIGVLGPEGRGVCEYFQLTQKDVPCLITPLGKALGSMGAIVSGSSELIEYLIQFAKSYRYSTALPPAIAAATNTALKILQQETWRREKLQTLIHFFDCAAKARHLPLLSHTPTPIKSILIGENALAIRLQARLQEKGFLIASIRPPTVPEASARIRISLNCLLTENNILQLLDCLAEELN
jgi:8-amino-7-oxononanoate synthase